MPRVHDVVFQVNGVVPSVTKRSALMIADYVKHRRCVVT